MEREPSNRDLMHYIQDIKVDVGEIKVQTSKTNGRVGALENWRWFISGGLAIILVLIIPIVLIVIQNYNSK